MDPSSIDNPNKLVIRSAFNAGYLLAEQEHKFKNSLMSFAAVVGIVVTNILVARTLELEHTLFFSTLLFLDFLLVALSIGLVISTRSRYIRVHKETIDLFSKT